MLIRAPLPKPVGPGTTELDHRELNALFDVARAVQNVRGCDGIYAAIIGGALTISRRRGSVGAVEEGGTISVAKITALSADNMNYYGDVYAGDADEVTDPNVVLYCWKYPDDTGDIRLYEPYLDFTRVNTYVPVIWRPSKNHWTVLYAFKRPLVFIAQITGVSGNYYKGNVYDYSHAQISAEVTLYARKYPVDDAAMSEYAPVIDIGSTVLVDRLYYTLSGASYTDAWYIEGKFTKTCAV